MQLFIRFFIAHLLGDFFLQPGKWVNHKEQKKWGSWFLYVHVLIHAALILLISQDIHYWKAAIIIAFSHLIIDGLKLQLQKEHTRRLYFFIDQLLHILVLIAVSAYMQNIPFNMQWLQDDSFLTITAAFIFLVTPASIFIRMVISKWTPLKDDTEAEKKSLEDAGAYIGIMERLLIFTFMMYGQWEGIGFLLAAKSVFRFGDLKESKDRKLTEYILIGTLLSFGIAIVTGLITLHVTK